MNESGPPSSNLGVLRAQIDAIDSQIHDLLMRRAAVVEGVARDSGKGGTKIRPGREAIILRRLLARHEGTLPAQAITRVWRELFAAALIIEGGQTVAVCDGEGGVDRTALAREHFGPLTPLRRHHNPSQTLADVARETAQVAVLPAPSETDDNWWPMLTASGQHRLYVIGKLPFWTRRAEGSPQGEAFVVAGIPPDPSGDDHGLIAILLSADVSRARVARIFADAGFNLVGIWMKRSAGDTIVQVLAEVEGFVQDDDARLAAIAGLEMPPAVIGAFAVPL